MIIYVVGTYESPCMLILSETIPMQILSKSYQFLINTGMIQWIWRLKYSPLPSHQILKRQVNYLLKKQELQLHATGLVYENLNDFIIAQRGHFFKRKNRQMTQS